MIRRVRCRHLPGRSFFFMREHSDEDQARYVEETADRIVALFDDDEAFIAAVSLRKAAERVVERLRSWRSLSECAYSQSAPTPG